MFNFKGVKYGDCQETCRQEGGPCQETSCKEKGGSCQEARR
jgi:hypothetical protein